MEVHKTDKILWYTVSNNTVILHLSEILMTPNDTINAICSCCMFRQ